MPQFRIKKYQLLSYVLVYLFASMPFSVKDYNIVLMQFNRAIFTLVGMFTLNDFIKKENYKIGMTSIRIYLFIFALYSTIISLRYFESNYLSFTKEMIQFLCVIFIISYLKNNHQSQITVNTIYFIVLFYSADVMIQAYFGKDLFGFVSLVQGRPWGAFHYGAPTAGIFIAQFIWLPFLVHRKKIYYFSFTFLIFALILTNDRAPIFIVITSIIIYVVLWDSKNIIYVFTLLLVFCFFVFKYKHLLPLRIQSIIDLYPLLLSEDINLYDENFIRNFSLHDYVLYWTTNISIWFDPANFLFIIFGVGIGNLQAFFIHEGGFPRTHNMLLELFFTFGILGSSMIVYTLQKVFFLKTKRLLLITVYFTPFLFFSLFSFNQILMFIISTMVYFSSNGELETNGRSIVSNKI